MKIKEIIINHKFAKSGIIFSAALLFSFTLLSLFAPILGSNASNQSTQELSANINPVISLSAPEDLNFTITPTSTGTFDSKELKVNVSTNAIKGYELYFSSEDEATDMKHASSSISNKISSNFTGSLTSTSMTNNTWGYSLNNTDFSSIPKKSNQIKLKDLNTYPTATDRTQSVYFGVKADTTLPSGIYEKNVIFTAVAHANPAKPLHDISKMQEMTTATCDATTTPKKESTTLDTDGSHQGDPNYVPTKTLTDTRDNNTYTVSKLADGKCWMTQNLRITGKTITSSDSDVSGSYVIPTSALSGFGPNDISIAYDRPNYGGYYNWYTATAGTGKTTSAASQDMISSICPKNWKLPSGKTLTSDFYLLYKQYPSSSSLQNGPFHAAKSEYAIGSSIGGAGIGGYFWSSTHENGDNTYVLNFDPNSVNPSTSTNKAGFGFAVRCVAR